jgi:TonB family protein
MTAIRLVLLLLALSLGLPAFSQSTFNREASFPGGDNAMVQWVSEHLVFPEEARREGVNGVLKVFLLVDTLGKAQVISFLGDTLGFGCEKAVREMVDQMPLWSPALSDGIKVNYQNILPIHFNLGTPKRTEIEYFKNAEIMPSFRGGDSALVNYIRSALKKNDHMRAGEQGQVTLEFFIETNGKIESCWVSKSTNEALNSLAIQIIKEMPAWNPASIDHKPVRVLRSITLDFD